MYKTVSIKFLPLCVCFLLFSAVIIGIISLNGEKAVPASAETSGKCSVEVPIIMYHAVSQVKSIQGDYVISDKEFEDDLIYLKNKGYNTVTVNDIVEFVNGKGNLPDKPIVLTFDDGYYNNYLYVYSLLKKYGYKASLSPIAYYSELYSQSGETNECYTHCTWTQLTEMTKSGYIELGNHSYNLHSCDGVKNGLGKIAGESDEAYRTRITEDIKMAQDMIYKNTGVTCGFIAYPFGVYNDSTEAVVKSMGFNAALTCSEGVNSIKRGDSEKLYNLYRFIRPHNRGLESILGG